MADLFLRVYREYFDKLVSGEKCKEYRIASPYWLRRIVYPDHLITGVHIVCGYPKSETLDQKNSVWFPWNHYQMSVLKHPQFGDQYVPVIGVICKPYKLSFIPDSRLSRLPMDVRRAIYLGENSRKR